MQERAEVLECEGNQLVSILHEPQEIGDTGVVIIVAGGPQYRVGAHRQFVLLARQLAASGIPVVRFDHRGTGDSEGDYRGFLDMNTDIRCAVDFLYRSYPHLKNTALWGECESASAAAYYAYTDDRIGGIFMVNPWVRTEVGLAKTYLKHHYRARLMDPEFWQKVRSGNFSISNSLGSVVELFKQVIASKFTSGISGNETAIEDLPLTQRLEECLLRFHREIFVLTSGRDHIAQEYKDFVDSSKTLGEHLSGDQVELYEIEDSDHTFSRSEWREELFEKTEIWLGRLSNPEPGT